MPLRDSRVSSPRCFPTQKRRRHLEKIKSTLLVYGHHAYMVARHKEGGHRSAGGAGGSGKNGQRVQEYIQSCEDQNKKLVEEEREARYADSMKIWEKKNKLEQDLLVTEEEWRPCGRR